MVEHLFTRQKRHRVGSLICLNLILVSLELILSQPASAQDETETGWSDTAEFSLFMTNGNAEAQSLALRNTLRREWESSRFELDAGALRAETTTGSRAATGTADDFVISESSDSEVTAENYFLRGRYERDTTDDYFWFASAGWERNEFAGIANRFVLVAGVGTVWFERDDGHFKTDYGVTYTDQEDVIENPAADDVFVGLRLSWDYGRQLTETTHYSNDLIVDGNIDESSDYRADMVNALAVEMTSKLALKMSLQFLYDNAPALEEIPLFTPLPPDAIEVSTALAPLDELDTILTASLVVGF